MKSPKKDFARAYANPPVLEALCEVRFASATWCDSIVHTFFEEVKEFFPHRMVGGTQADELIERESGDTSNAGTDSARELFLSKTSDGIIQIAKGLYVFNQLAPYRPFSEWKEDAIEGLIAYMRLISPKCVERIGVRYLNRFEIPGNPVKMEDYFNVYPMLPGGLGDGHFEFTNNVTIPMGDDGHSLEFTFRSLGGDNLSPVKQIFLLDLHARSPNSLEAQKAEIEKHIVLAHNNVVKAFEGTITERLRDLMGRKEQQ